MIHIFIAYSSKDLVFKEEIRKRLGPFKRAGKVDIWDNYDIEAGANWDSEVREKLENSDLVLLLLSPDAIDSDYFYDVEAPIALRRHEAGEAIAVGILLRPCDLKYTPFGDLTRYELLPKKGYPIVNPHWHHVDEAYLAIIKEIDVLIERIETLQRRNDEVRTRLEKERMEKERLEKVQLEKEQAIHQKRREELTKTTQIKRVLGINEMFAPRLAEPQKQNDSYMPPQSIIQKKVLGRNDPCPCGSGLKFKNCHGK